MPSLQAIFLLPVDFHFCQNYYIESAISNACYRTIGSFSQIRPLASLPFLLPHTAGLLEFFVSSPSPSLSPPVFSYPFTRECECVSVVVYIPFISRQTEPESRRVGEGLALWIARVWLEWLLAIMSSTLSLSTVWRRPKVSKERRSTTLSST